MYIPPHFAETDAAWIAEFVKRIGAGTLVTHGATQLHANFVPLIFDADQQTLRGHLARANMQTQDFQSARDALVIFQGPHGYVSPSFYPSKAVHHRVVPTWNYETVQMTGALSFKPDVAWLMQLLNDLTAQHEHARPLPWKPADAPQEFIEGLTHSIIGFELVVSRVEAKRKLSENKDEADRWGTIAGVRDDDNHALADAMESKEL